MATVVEPSESIGEAVQRLRAGRPVVFPTETVYGLGADTSNPLAIRLVFTIKGRPADNPLIAHVAGEPTARTITKAWDETCEQLAERFWPGPLTLVLNRSETVPDVATAGLSTIAVRCPRHPVALQLLEAFGGAISAPSANRSGRVSPTTAAHVAEDLADVDDLLILDGGRCEVGIESTVLDLTSEPPRVLRPGSVTIIELREVLDRVERQETEEQTISPGTSPIHYAPETPAEIVAGDLIPAILEELSEPVVVVCFDGSSVPPPHSAIEMPSGAGDYARKLYEVLRRADASGASRILIEQPPVSNEIWRAINDRLLRATSS